MFWRRYYFRVEKSEILDEYCIRIIRGPRWMAPSFKTKEEAENYLKEYINKNYPPFYKFLMCEVLKIITQLLLILLHIVALLYLGRFIVGGFSAIRVPVEFITMILAIPIIWLTAKFIMYAESENSIYRRINRTIENLILGQR